MAAPLDALGLTNVLARLPARVPVRLRASEVTRAGWRLEVASDQGAGGIVLVEISPMESYYRGDGIFLGWPQARLAEAYKSLVVIDDPDPGLPQLG